MNPASTNRHTVRLTANFEQNLDEIERFLAEADTPQVFDALLDELAGTVIPNLERFPAMGRALFGRPIRSVEVSNGLAGLRNKLARLDEPADIREYLLSNYLLLYLHTASAIHLLSIRHHKQLSFDIQLIERGG